MGGDVSGHEEPTRRAYVKYGGAVVGGGVLAGRAGQQGAGGTPGSTVIATDAGESEPAEADGSAAEKSHETRVRTEDHPAGRRLTAVQDDAVSPDRPASKARSRPPSGPGRSPGSSPPQEFGALAPEGFPDVPEERRPVVRGRVEGIAAGDV